MNSRLMDVVILAFIAVLMGCSADSSNQPTSEDSFPTRVGDSALPGEPMSGPPEEAKIACTASDLDGPVEAPSVDDSNGPAQLVFEAGTLTQLDGLPCESSGCPTCLYGNGYLQHYCMVAYECEKVQPGAQSGFYYLGLFSDGESWRWRLYSFYYPYQDSEGAPYQWDLGPAEHQPDGPCEDGNKTGLCSACLEACAGMRYCSCKEECSAEDCG